MAHVHVQNNATGVKSLIPKEQWERMKKEDTQNIFDYTVLADSDTLKPAEVKELEAKKETAKTQARKPKQTNTPSDDSGNGAGTPTTDPASDTGSTTTNPATQ